MTYSRCLPHHGTGIQHEVNSINCCILFAQFFSKRRHSLRLFCFHLKSEEKKWRLLSRRFKLHHSVQYSSTSNESNITVSTHIQRYVLSYAVYHNSICIHTYCSRKISLYCVITNSEQHWCGVILLGIRTDGDNEFVLADSTVVHGSYPWVSK